MKFKVGQVVTATEHAAALNRAGTYIVTHVSPGVVLLDGCERPYYIRALVGPIPYGKVNGVLKLYAMPGAWAMERQLQALPDDVLLALEAELQNSQLRDEQDQQAEAYRRLSEVAARRRRSNEPSR